MTRSATYWHKCIDRYGRTILYITSNEVGISGVAICSIYDAASDEVSYRLMLGGERRELDPESDAPYPETGLIVLGSWKGNRPDMDELRALTGMHGAIAADAIEAAINA